MNYKSGILSLLLTGLGQIRNGSLVKGLVFMFAPLAALLIAQLGVLDKFFGLITFLIIFLIWKIACIIDALIHQKVDGGWYSKPIVIGVLLVFWYTIPLFTLVKEFRKYSTYGAFRVPTTSMKSTLHIGDCFISKRVSPEELKRGEITVFIYPDAYFQNEVMYVKRCIALPGDKVQIIGGQVFTNSEKEKVDSTFQSEYFARVAAGFLLSDLEDLGIDEFAMSQDESGYTVYCTDDQATKLKQSKKVLSVQLVREENTSPMVWPHSGELNWNVDNYGPVDLPEKGEMITLNDSTLRLYSSVIIGEGGSIDNESYTFQKNYFFMLGDNRKRSADSRYWGFVPEENILSRALYLYWSKDKSRIGLDLTKES